MKGNIIEQSGKTGEIAVVDGEFTWTYNGDEPIVESALRLADNYTIPEYQGDDESVDGKTATSNSREAPAEVKYAFAKKEFKGISVVWKVHE